MKKLHSIPKNAKKVFSGLLFDVYQWQQRLYDGSFTTFEAVTRPDTVAILAVTDDNKILVTKEKQPVYNGWIFSVPGGRVEQDEDPLITAKRELKEETGLTAKTLKLYTSIYPESKIDYAVHIITAKNLVQSGKQELDAGEQIKIIYMTPLEFVKLVLSDKFRYSTLTNLIINAIVSPNKYKDLLEHLNITDLAKRIAQKIMV